MRSIEELVREEQLTVHGGSRDRRAGVPSPQPVERGTYPGLRLAAVNVPPEDAKQ